MTISPPAMLPHGNEPVSLPFGLGVVPDVIGAVGVVPLVTVGFVGVAGVLVDVDLRISPARLQLSADIQVSVTPQRIPVPAGHVPSDLGFVPAGTVGVVTGVLVAGVMVAVVVDLGVPQYSIQLE